MYLGSLPREWVSRLRQHYLDTVITARKPDFIIGAPEDPYMLRWYLRPRNHIHNHYLHVILRPDDDRALHDHPSWSVSLCLQGPLRDIRPGGVRRTVCSGNLIGRSAHSAHRLELYGCAPETITWLAGVPGLALGVQEWYPAITLFWTGPRIRNWGFHCPQGWKPWQEYCSLHDNGENAGQIGRGCD